MQVRNGKIRTHFHGGGGFIFFSFSPLSLGKGSNVTNIFQMGGVCVCFWGGEVSFSSKTKIAMCKEYVFFLEGVTT